MRPVSTQWPAPEVLTMKRWFAFAVVAVGAFLAGMWVCGFFAQDACLDAGGSWDHRRGLCLGVDVQDESGR